MDVQCSIWNETYRLFVHDIQRPPWYKFRDASVIARRKWSARSSISIPKQENEKKEKNESEKINCYKCKSYLGPFQVFSSVIDCKLYPREHISGLELENIWKIFHLLVIGRSGPSPPFPSCPHLQARRQSTNAHLFPGGMHGRSGDQRL